MQITAFSGFAQQIIGFNNVANNVGYKIAKAGPDIEYDWTVTNGNYTVNVCCTTFNEEITVDWNTIPPYPPGFTPGQIGLIEVTETPVIASSGSNYILLNNLITIANQANPIPPPPYSNDLVIQNAIDAMWAAGGGTVEIAAGEYYVGRIFLKEGVRIIGQGQGPGGTTLKRLVDGDYTPFKVSPMFRTYRKIDNDTKMEHTFLANSDCSVDPDINSKPIEIAFMTLDNSMPNIDNDTFEHQGIIFLDAPTHITTYPPPIYDGDLPANIGYLPNGHHANGSGNLKVFIHHIDFENSGGDGVEQRENVNLTMHDCNGYSAMRGTFSLTAGGGLSRISKIETIVTTANSRGCDLEPEDAVMGYYPVGLAPPGYRAWIDDCKFDFGFHMSFKKSKLLVTNTQILKKNMSPYGIDYAVFEFFGPGGSAICRNSKIPVSNIYSNNVNNVNTSMCAKFIDCEFTLIKMKAPTPNPFSLADGCANGLKTHDLLYGTSSKIGFQDCVFNRTNFDIGDISYGVIFLHDFTPSDVIFYNSGNTITPPNNGLNPSIIFQPYMYNNISNCAEFTNGGGLILPIAGVVEPGVNDCGESEDEMKEHFGIRKIYLLQWTAFNHTNITCTGSGTDGEIHVNAAGIPGIVINYNLQPNNITNLTGDFIALGAGIYTVTATDATNFTITSIITLIGPTAGHCQCANGQALVSTPNVILQYQATASDLISNYGTTISNKTFYFDDVFTIDADITFDDCTLWFTQSGTVQLIGPNDITIQNGSILQASCDWWGGIEANDPQQKVTVDNSMVRNMHIGIWVANSAVLEATNSTYEDNANRSMRFVEMNDPAYPGKVEGNTFNGMQNECLFGIEIFNSNYINIGDALNPNSVNTFTGLQTGIDIRGDANIGTLLGPSNQIGIYNNVFVDIKNNLPAMSPIDINNSVYTTPVGAAVNIDYTLAAATFAAHTTVSYTGGATATTVLFQNCSKGIVNQNGHLVTEKLYMDDTWFGIMNRNMATKECTVQNNKIENTSIGTQLIGNYSNYYILQNEIILNEGIGAPYNGIPQQILLYPAVGIDIKQLNPPNLSTQTFDIKTNTIYIPYYAGKGVGNLGANANQHIEDNTILFTVANGTPQAQVPAYDPSLYGVYNSNCKEIKLRNNLVKGLYSLNNYQLTYSKAYYFETSSDMVLTCNKGRATKQGFYVWGKNETGNENIKFNKFRFNLNPLYTLDGGAPQAGTFGNIGDGVIDNGNDWTYNMGGNNTWLLNQQFKVWRSSSLQPQYYINTLQSLLDPTESGSTNLGVNDYLVYNNVNPVLDPCLTDPDFENAVPPNVMPPWNEIDIENAEAVALQQQTYINYVEVGQWLNNRNLYERLVLDTVLRNSSFVLSDFYNIFSNTTISTITQTETSMNALYDFQGTTLDMMMLYSAAIDSNNAILSNNDHELYEQVINNLALRLTVYGKDSISEIQKTELEFIAHLCPFVGGSAVYKARVLWAMYSPIMQYNDRLNCLQNIGQNKTGNTGYLNLDSLYELQTYEQAGILAEQIQNASAIAGSIKPAVKLIALDGIVVYPNPASSHIIVAYKSNVDGVFKLFNSLGDVVLSTSLSKENTKTQVQIPDIANGLYHYEIKFASREKTIGKLTILK